MEHLRVEKLFKCVNWVIFEMDRWLCLSVESHQSVPRSAVVVNMTVGDDVLSRVSRNKEGEL